METIDRIGNLYADWYSSQTESRRKMADATLQGAKRVSVTLDKLIMEMGDDGLKMMDLFEGCWQQFGETKVAAKKALSAALANRTRMDEDAQGLFQRDGTYENEAGVQHYYPVMDRSNAMVSVINPNDRDVIVQIRHAITGGNYQIAEALILNSWGRLTVNDRLSLIEWVEYMDQYNLGSGVPRSGYTRLAKMKKDTETRAISKEEFKDKFLLTARENMKVGK